MQGHAPCPKNARAKTPGCRGRKQDAVTGFVLWSLVLALTDCSTLNSYGQNQLNAELPIEPGDRVTIYLDNLMPGVRPLVVTAIARDSISGEPADGLGGIETYRWDEIRRIEHREDRSALVWTTVGIIVILGAVKATGDAVDDIVNLFSRDE